MYMWGRAIELGLKGVAAGDPKGATQRLQGTPAAPREAPHAHVLETLATSDYRPENKIQVHAVSGGQTWLVAGPGTPNRNTKKLQGTAIGPTADPYPHALEPGDIRFSPRIQKSSICSVGRPDLTISGPQGAQKWRTEALWIRKRV